ncbi:hypothetical protein [Aeromonas phage SW69-9]|nr:hypothetical protein [Aeromonas phage SW69-9]
MTNVSADEMITAQQLIAEKCVMFEEKCKAIDPGVRVEYTPTGFGEFQLTTINSEGTRVDYAFTISIDGQINIARII